MLVTLSFCTAQGNLRICLFSEPSVPCSWTLSKWSPYFHQKEVSGIDCPLSFTFTCSASFLTSWKTRVKALWFIRVMHLVPAATQKESEWCTSAGEHELAQCHNLCPCLLPQTLHKSAWGIKGATCRGSMSAAWCSINACDVVAYCKSCFLGSGISCLRSKYWHTPTAASTSCLDWPSAAFFINLSPSTGDAETSLTQGSSLSATWTHVSPSEKPYLPSWWHVSVGCTVYTPTHPHTTCGKAWGNCSYTGLSVGL